MRIEKYPLTKSTIIILLTYMFSFIDLPYLKNFNTIRKFSVVLVLFLLFPHIKVFMKKKYRLINISLLVFGVLIICSGIINRGKLITIDPLASSLLFALRICVLFMTVEYCSEKKQMRHMILAFYRITFILVMINDLILLIYPTLDEAMGSLYFIGDKFLVVYTHYQLMAMFIILNFKKLKFSLNKKILLVIHFILTFIVAVSVECMTGVIGNILFAMFCLLLYYRKSLLRRPVVFIITLLVSSSFVTWYKVILINPIVQSFVTATLGRSLTLTGRTIIYAGLPDVLKGNLMWGYGYGSSYEVCMKYLGFANTQNGVYEWILHCGIPTTLSLLSIFYLVLYIYNKNSEKNVLVPALSLLYVYAIISSIEISINTMLIFWLAVILGYSNQDFIGGNIKVDNFFNKS